MPYSLKKISARRYSVVNKKTGAIHAKRTTLKKAQSQIRLLNAIDHGYVPK
jgi:hypothetical protein